jgi:uncharacterized protein (TIGR02452 family)
MRSGGACSHLYAVSPKLSRALRTQSSSTALSRNLGGVVDENDHIMINEGFVLGDGCRQEMPPVITVPISLSDPISFEQEQLCFTETEICVANIDTVSAAIVLGDACILSFANAEIPGGRYRSNGRAQEEDLCRLLPQLYPSLIAAADCYPITPGTALLTPTVEMVRVPRSYDLCCSMGNVSVITAAMPCGTADHRPPGGFMNSEWDREVTIRIRAVINAAKVSRRKHLVLGAFGCGAFGNPPKYVASIFKRELSEPSNRGFFSAIVFAIIDPVGTGNVKPFREILCASEHW